MTDIILATAISAGILTGIITLLCANFIDRRVKSRFKDFLTDIRKELREIQGDHADKEALTCVHPLCQRRKTACEYQQDRLVSIGYAAFKRKLDESKPDPLSLCEQCNAKDFCELRDPEMINCDGFIKEGAEDDVRKSNIEAAGSVNINHADLTDDSLKGATLESLVDMNKKIKGGK
jgi:hypothetical protein